MRRAITKSARIGLAGAGIVCIALVLAVRPAPAQFGTIFGGDPPRPPANVPNRAPADTPPQTIPAPAGGRGTAVQSQPLPPPPGAPAVPLDTRPQQGALPPAGSPGPTPGLAPGQRQPRGTPQQPGTAPPATPPAPGAPAPVAVAPPDENVDAPTPKIPNNSAVFSGLDKITGRIISFDVALNETVQFGALQVTPRACYTRPPTELPLTDGFVEVSEVTLQGEVRRIFTGWMYAASPGLHGVEHSIYDVWLTDCKEPQQTKVAEDPAPPPQRPARPTTPAPAGAAAPRQPARQGQPGAAPRGAPVNPR